jgi:PAS domain S-box-containing protein
MLAWMQPTETPRHRSRDVPLCDIKRRIIVRASAGGLPNGHPKMSKPADGPKRRTAKRKRPKAARIAEQSATEILESLSDALVVLDRQGRCTYINRVAEGMAGLSREEMLGRTIWEVFPEGTAQFEAACRRAMESAVTVRFEEYYPTLNTWFEHTCHASADRVTVSARDITERKQMEEALRGREERFRRYFELGLIGMAITSPTKGILEVNDCICEILGYERSELLQLTWAELTHPDDLAADIESFNRVMAGEIDGYVMDKRWIRKNGQVIDAMISVKCMRRLDGSVDYFLALLQDVTERKRAQEALRERERLMLQITELSPVVLDVFDLATGRHTYRSSNTVSLFGYTPDEIEQMENHWAVLVYPEDMPRLQENIERLKRLNDGEINEFECRVQRPDGEWRWVLARSMVFARNERGEVWQEINATFDITEHKRAEQALRASEERLRLLVESAEDYAIITFDTEGRVSGWNSGATRTFGYDEAEIIGRSGEILFTPEDRELGVPAEEMKLAREKKRAVNERYYFRKDRTRFFGSGVTNVLHDHAGQGYVKIVRDLTERTQAEEALHRAHEELEERVLERTRELTALNEELKKEITERKRAQEELRRSEVYLVEGQTLSHTGSGAWNVSTGDVFWSDEMYRIYGFEPRSVQPSYEVFSQLVHPDERLSLQRAFENVVLEASDYDLEFRIIRPDGAIRSVHSVGHPTFNESGELTELVGTVMDITDRKEAEEKLAASEHRFRLLLESIPHHIWSFRADGSIGYWNQRLIDYTGLTTEELAQGCWAAIHPDDVEPCRAAWRDAWSKRTPFEREQRVRGRDGRYRRFLSRGVPVPGEAGQLLEWFGTDTDIEDLRQAQETLHVLQAELAHMARVTTMGELVASIAHEVNQPLTGVITNSHACVRWLVRDTPSLEEAQDCLGRIIQEAHRASEVINRIRTFLKRGSPEKVLLDINELIRDTIALVAREVARKEVLVQTDLAAGLAAVLGDRIQLQQVMLNLVMNAMEAISTKGDGPREILLTSREQAADQIVVTVRDSGVGIDPAKMDQLFQPFFSTKAAGMGMGLSISRSLIEAHGGRLWAIPEERDGATFQFSLPAHAPA